MEIHKENHLHESVGLPACFLDVLVIHLVIALASAIDCFCADSCFACLALSGYSLSLEAWYTFGWVPVLQDLLSLCYTFNVFLSF